MGGIGGQGQWHTLGSGDLHCLPRLGFAFKAVDGPGKNPGMAAQQRFLPAGFQV